MPVTFLGYTKDLFILPFDHRGSFAEKLFGIKGRVPTAEETKEIASYKQIIYEGFLKALDLGVPRDKAGILVDEQYGQAIIKDGLAKGIKIAVPAEKSGQDEFDFEYGENFAEHIKKFNPTFVKVLVRYNPQADKAANKIQLARLKRLSDYCHSDDRKFMFELLVPATKEQLASCEGSTARYDASLRPKLMVQAMHEIQDSGVEPDVWKNEGIENVEDCNAVAEAGRKGAHRKDVGVIILGRGESAQKVREWLTVAAKTPSLIGFAVGRTVFWDALKFLKDGKHERAAAVNMVANNYKGFCDLWISAKA